MSSLNNQGPDAPRPSGDGESTSERRQFSGAYKQQVLDELARCGNRGERTAVLRREGLLWSHITKWRKQRDQGMLDDSWAEATMRGRLKMLMAEREELLAELDEVFSENERLREQVAQSPSFGRLKQALMDFLKRKDGRSRAESGDGAATPDGPAVTS